MEQYLVKKSYYIHIVWHFDNSQKKGKMCLYSHKCTTCVNCDICEIRKLRTLRPYK